MCGGVIFHRSHIEIELTKSKPTCCPFTVATLLFRGPDTSDEAILEEQASFSHLHQQTQKTSASSTKLTIFTPSAYLEIPIAAGRVLSGSAACSSPVMDNI